MRKRLLTNALLATLALASAAQAQRTLRIDYVRRGNFQGDTVLLQRFVAKHSPWAGNPRQPIDPIDNGEYCVAVADAITGKTLYSRHYNSLFQEYRSTPQGKSGKVESFEEVALVPFPEQPVDIIFQKRDDKQVLQTQASFRFDPATTPLEHVERNMAARVLPLQMAGEPANKIDVVIVPEGYGPNDKEKMTRDLLAFKKCLLDKEPFASRDTDFNVWGVMALGDTTGITDPARHVSVNSAVGSSYGTFGSDRYLMTQRLFQLHNLIDRVPCDHIIIMANSATYGGGAIYNFYAMSAVQEMSEWILPHELGHSIGGLADEYVEATADTSFDEMHPRNEEPIEPNITTLVAFDKKWKALVPDGTPIPTPPVKGLKKGECGPIGVYEGAGYVPKGVYRPVTSCMMRDYHPFCPVCTKRLNEVFDSYCK